MNLLNADLAYCDDNMNILFLKVLKTILITLTKFVTY